MATALFAADCQVNTITTQYDDAQSIYRKKSLKFPLSSAGIQARGRTTILKLNYRNTREILTFAYEFAKDFLQAQEADEDNVPLIAPEVAGASGPAPVFKQCASAEGEANYIARCIKQWQAQGHALNSIAVVYPQHWQAELIQKQLTAMDVPCAWLKDNIQKKSYDPAAEQVVLLTRQSSKGLEFDTVVLSGVGNLNDDEEEIEREVRLLYVGMTRARRHLLVTGAGENWYMAQFKAMTG